MIHAVPEPPPLYVRIPASRAREIRSACAWIGGLLTPLSIVLGVAVVQAGRRLPTNFHPVNGGVWAMAAVGAFTLFCSAIALGGARPYVRGEHLDLNGARITRRVLGALWGGAICTAALACFLLIMTAGTSHRQNPGFTGEIWAYLGLLLVAPASTGGLFFVGRSLFRRSTAPG